MATSHELLQRCKELLALLSSVPPKDNAAQITITEVGRFIQRAEQQEIEQKKQHVHKHVALQQEELREEDEQAGIGYVPHELSTKEQIDVQKAAEHGFRS